MASTSASKSSSGATETNRPATCSAQVKGEVWNGALGSHSSLNVSCVSSGGRGATTAGTKAPAAAPGPSTAASARCRRRSVNTSRARAKFARRASMDLGNASAV
eukprot:7242627-Pyramimonas_sp.AAC.1